MQNDRLNIAEDAALELLHGHNVINEKFMYILYVVNLNYATFQAVFSRNFKQDRTS